MVPVYSKSSSGPSQAPERKLEAPLNSRKSAVFEGASGTSFASGLLSATGTLSMTALLVLSVATGAEAASSKAKKTQESAPLPAETFIAPPVGQPAYSWLLTIRGNVLVSPDFPGSKTYGFVVYPSLSWRRSDTPERFEGADDGVSIALFGDSQWAAGLVGRYQSGRYRENDKSRLYGISDAKWALEPGIFGEYWVLADALRLRGEVRYGINGYNGVVGMVSADYVKKVGKFTLSLGPRVNLAGGEYMDTYFGVTAQDAAFNKNVTAYSADAGVKSVGIAGAATYRWNDAFSTTVRGGYDRLVGSAADSPIVKNLGSANQFTIGASANYTFDITRYVR
jgi:outer membrane scaffolding protein for murein synthesis (MipA/OmpV family)